MKSSELIMRLEAMRHHNGDLEVVVIDNHGDVTPLKTQVEVDRFDPGGPDLLVLEALDF